MTEQNNKRGLVYIPYKIETTATMINGQYVWYKNRWKNMMLKIKHFFVKPKYIKNLNLYKDKKIDSSNYMVMNININNIKPNPNENKTNF